MKKIFLSLFLVFAVSSVYGPCFSFRLNGKVKNLLKKFAVAKTLFIFTEEMAFMIMPDSFYYGIVADGFSV